MLCLHNVTNETVQLTLELPGVTTDHRWLDLLSRQNHFPDTDGRMTIQLSPYQILWARLEEKIKPNPAEALGRSNVRVASNPLRALPPGQLVT